MILDFHDINSLIGEKIDKGDPASILRMDNTIGYVLDCFNKKEMPVAQFFNQLTFIEGGIYPIDGDFYYQRIVPEMYKSMHDSDILGFVDISGDILRGNFLNNFDTNKVIFAGNNHNYLVMDPGALLGLSHFGKVDDPWTSHLKDKKVLVISTHLDSIKHQWKKIDKVWGNNKNLIASFKLVDVIHSPYHPNVDNRQYGKFNDWLECVEHIKGIIDTYDYDILLAGCSTSAPLYCTHAKLRGKIGIQTGGVLQLFFGLIGKRWLSEGHYARWREMFNEHWIFPLLSDHAQQKNNYNYLETNQAYW